MKLFSSIPGASPVARPLVAIIGEDEPLEELLDGVVSLLIPVAAAPASASAATTAVAVAVTVVIAIAILNREWIHASVGIVVAGVPVAISVVAVTILNRERSTAQSSSRLRTTRTRRHNPLRVDRRSQSRKLGRNGAQRKDSLDSSEVLFLLRRASLGVGINSGGKGGLVSRGLKLGCFERVGCGDVLGGVDSGLNVDLLDREASFMTVSVPMRAGQKWVGKGGEIKPPKGPA